MKQATHTSSSFPMFKSICLKSNFKSMTVNSNRPSNNKNRIEEFISRGSLLVTTKRTSSHDYFTQRRNLSDMNFGHGINGYWS